MNDIETLLRNSSRQTLDVPAAEILRRGDRMRRLRRGTKAVAAVAAFSVAGVLAYRRLRSTGPATRPTSLPRSSTC